MPPSLSITSWILAGIDSTRFYRKFVSAVLWRQTWRMAACLRFIGVVVVVVVISSFFRINVMDPAAILTLKQIK
jgi:hypothetical protein